MDPNAALAALRELFRQVDAGEYHPTDLPFEDVRESFEALDKWLTGGGFPPADWSKR